MFDRLQETDATLSDAMSREKLKDPSAHPLDLWLRARRAAFAQDFLAVNDVCSERFQSNRDEEEVDADCTDPTT